MAGPVGFIAIRHVWPGTVATLDAATASVKGKQTSTVDTRKAMETSQPGIKIGTKIKCF